MLAEPQDSPGHAKLAYHPQLVDIVSNNDTPMLRRIRVLANLLRNRLADNRLLSEPLSTCATYRMPTKLDHTLVAINVRFARRHLIWLVTKSDGMLEIAGRFDRRFPSFVEIVFSAVTMSMRCIQRLQYLQKARDLVAGGRLVQALLFNFATGFFLGFPPTASISFWRNRNHTASMSLTESSKSCR